MSVLNPPMGQSYRLLRPKKTREEVRVVPATYVFPTEIALEHHSILGSCASFARLASLARKKSTCPFVSFFFLIGG